MPIEKDDLTEGLANCLEELKDSKIKLDNWKAWIDSLEELSEIEDAFGIEERDKLHGKTFLDIGTDCVKPLYIALKFEPDKIIGISEEFSRYPFASGIKSQSRLFTTTNIKLYQCSFFEKEKLANYLKRAKQKTSDFVLVSKTLHHLRTGECVAKNRDRKHKCQENEESVAYTNLRRKTFSIVYLN